MTEKYTDWLEDVFKGLAASRFDMNQKKRKEFEPQSIFGMYIKQVVDNAVQEGKKKYE